jgi:cytochrome c biogenesis factor
MKKLSREQNKKFNKISVIVCTVIAFIGVLLPIIIEGKNYTAGILITVGFFFFIWIGVYIVVFLGIYWGMELFNGFKEESLTRKIITIIIFLTTIIGLTIKIMHDIK